MLTKLYEENKNVTDTSGHHIDFIRTFKIAKVLDCLTLTFLTVVILSSLPGCKHYHRNSNHPEISNESISKGEALSKKYCGSCHLFPDPSLLDTKSWEEGVLPNMGPRLGIFEFNFRGYPSLRNDRNLATDFYPSTAIVDAEEWQNMLNYYLATSPDTMPPVKLKLPAEKILTLFRAEVPTCGFDIPATSFVKIDAAAAGHEIIISDVLRQNLYRFDKNLQLRDSTVSGGPIVNLDVQKDQILACDIGIMPPSNERYGKARIVSFQTGEKMSADNKAIFSKLERPVQITPADLNMDGKIDYLVCEFGYLTGSLSWMENRGSGDFIHHVIRPVTGALKAYVEDYNHDGAPDIWVLFAQGNEGVFLFTNKGHGLFEEESILRFPPVNGSSYFELDDFDKDGYKDILYTCGDNADFSPVLKPYHGVYIFINDGRNHFSKRYFYPMNGCYKAMARDFDGDGDYDIAAISFFPDVEHHPDEGFVYLENKGNYNFQPYTLPDARNGRWLSMDAGDVDGDGRTDLVLGNFSINSQVPGKRGIKAPPFILLRNIGKN